MKKPMKSASRPPKAPMSDEEIDDAALEPGFNPERKVAPTPGIVPLREPLQLVKGMRDILPAEWKWWDIVSHTVEKLSVAFGFDRIETPILEPTELFARSVGESTDIVEKEMFSFVDRGKNNLSMRPENTAGIARAYIEHGMFNLPQPVKLWYLGPMFRHDNPQAGRYRQFWQYGFEILGEQKPVLDAQLIQLAWRLYSSLGLTGLTVQINSVGDPMCRPQYIGALKEYFESHEAKLCKDCKKRLRTNTLRILDCKEEKCQRVIADAPQILDYLCEEDSNHFKQVLEYLDELEIPYQLNSNLVRGLDYYTKTVFEIWQEKAGANLALGGGGRYDTLVEQLGGRPTPAVGFAGGIERLILMMQDANIDVPHVRKADVFLGQLGELAKKKSLKVFEELRNAGIDAVEAVGKDSIKSQLRIADKLNVRFTLILGQKEVLEKTIILRDMDTGIQEVVDVEKIVPELKKRLEKKKSESGEVV